jgi:urease accessory protein
MDINQFGRTSKLDLTAAVKDGKTCIEDISFTAPYKVMLPFEKKNGGLSVMLMSASAGIMEGDRQEFTFDIKSGAYLEFISQSYDKVHQMNGGCAKRVTHIKVAENGTFFYDPQPMIPFRASAFESKMQIELKDKTSHFWLSEIFSCGRYARGEMFEYRFYHNLVEIKRENRLIYRDNTRFEPEIFDMSGMGMYEGYTHLLNIFVTRPENAAAFLNDVRDYLSEKESIAAGITELSDGDFAVRVLGMRAQKLEEINGYIKKLYENTGAENTGVNKID